MARLVLRICSPSIGEVVKAWMDCTNAGFCLPVVLVVVIVSHLRLALKVPDWFLQEVQHELTILIENNREKVFMNCE
jgi:hypothetical protein